MIKVKGTFKLVGYYEVELDMTQKQFDALSYLKQIEILDNSIDWDWATKGADVDEIEVEELEEVQK